MTKAYIFDIDGTLVDSNYQHALAWFEAFREFDITVPIWRIHRAIGMGGGMLVAHVTTQDVEDRYGDDLRDTWEKKVDPMIPHICAFEDAHETVTTIKQRGHAVALASSGKAKHVEAFVDLLALKGEVDAVLSSDDVERAKPHGDLLEVAMQKLGTKDAVMIGDSVWDCEAAGRASLPVIATRGGGFGVDELKDAGAERVVATLSELL